MNTLTDRLFTLLCAGIVMLTGSCTQRMPDGAALPEDHPNGPDLHDYGAAQDPPWWPVACEKNKSSK